MEQKKGVTEVEGVVTEALPNTMFRVKLSDEAPEDLAGQEILCTLSGKMRMYRIRVMPGDSAKIEVSDYDHSKGRIVFRYK
jgi:translation initiation factor IF-1